MITKEKYNFWNTLKQKIHFWKNKEKYPKAWEIWNIYNGLNIGYESKWKWNKFERPFLVIKKIWIMFLCISMTTKWKNNNKFYFKLNNKYFDKNSYITLSQWRCIDNRRFIKKIWKISCSDLYKIKKDLKSLWF
jgi:hypothetical protein